MQAAEGHRVSVTEFKLLTNALTTSAISVILVASCSPASACTICTDAMLWKVFPPILIWAWLGIAWFLALVILSAIWNQKIPFVPRIRTGAVLVMLGSLAPLMFGLSITLPFLACAFLGSVMVLRNRPERYSLKFAGIVLLLTILALAAIATTAAREVISPTPGEPIDVILRWGGTVPARAALSELERAEPHSATSYRRILEEAPLPGEIPWMRYAWPGDCKQLGFFSVSQAAKRLVIIEDPTIDAPLLIEALRRSRACSKDYDAMEIEETLRQMTGLSLPDGTSTDEWQQAWLDLKKQGDEMKDGHRFSVNKNG